MEKAYDLKGLVLKLKDHGLELSEEAAKILVAATFDWLDESASLSKNQADDFLKPFYPLVKKYALDMAEQINPAG